VLAVLPACAFAPRDPSPALPRAQAHLARGDTSAAARALEAGGARDAVDPVAATLLGRLYRERGTIHSRLLSQRVLENARARHSDDLDVAMELAQTYFAQGFYPDAVRIARDVLARDPSRCDARVLVGRYHFRKWKRMNQYADDLAAARRELRAALACVPGDADLAFRYLVAGYARGDSLARECDDFVARFPERPEFYLMRGAVAFEQARYDACARDFARGCEVLDPATRAVYESLTHVLAAGDESRYRSSSADVRGEIERGLWLTADPDPTTDVNPRLLEHTYRLFVADCLYSHEATARRGWETDRGEAFVRFGRPLHVDYSIGDVFAAGNVETWSFATAGVFHQLVFVDEFLNGNPRIPYRADRTLHFMRYTPAATTLAPDAADMAATVDAYVFRDSTTSGSIYVAMSVDAGRLRERVDVSAVDRYVVRGVYFDEAWRRAGGFVDTVRASEAGGARLAARPLEVVRRLRVPCDRYHVAVALEDEHTRARALGRKDADALRLLGDGLALSDVVLYRDVGASADRLAVIERGGARMRPRVGRRYAEGERVRAYVEVYNLALTTRAGVRASSYDLRYSIYPARGESDDSWVDWARRAVEWAGFREDEAVISQTFRREGRSHDDRESIAIDVDRLADGRYELVVEVEDRVLGRRAAAHAPFWKESAASAEARRAGRAATR
jgi:GWxTD domain-containing protein